MEFPEFCRLWQLSDLDRAQLAPLWKEYEGEPAKEVPEFLETAYFEKIYPLCQAKVPLAEILPRVRAVSRLAHEAPAVSVLAKIIFDGAFKREPMFKLTSFADPFPIFGEELSGVFTLMISLGAYPLIAAKHRALGIPQSYTDDLMAWFGGNMEMYALGHRGAPGREFGFSWVRLYVDGTLFRIGRLEYWMQDYRPWLPAIYRNAQGKVAALCRDNWMIGKHHQCVSDPAQADFTTHFTETETTVSGTLYCADGSFDPETVTTLDKAQWHPVAKPWSLCPSLHIPGGKRMPFDEIKSSLVAAKKFFADYFHQEVPLFCCNSWILNPAWETILPDSNIARFRREGHAIPAPPAAPRAGMGFVFGRADVDPTTLPATNSMQRAIQEAARQDKLDAGAVFFLADDLEDLGNEYYRE